MHKLQFSWGKRVGGLLETTSKTAGLLTSCLNIFNYTGKLFSFTTFFARFFHGFIHCDFIVFQSINYRFLPIFNSTYKYNNNIN